MRSPDRGIAKLRVEFRDQKWRNEIKSAAKEFDIELTGDWQEYSVSADSPPSTGDPSRDAWQIRLRIISDTGRWTVTMCGF